MSVYAYVYVYVYVYRQVIFPYCFLDTREKFNEIFFMRFYLSCLKKIGYS
jgi:hypothetical protein